MAVVSKGSSAAVPSFSRLVPRFLTESDFKPKTRLTFRASLRCLAGWCLDNGVASPGTVDLNRWKAYLLGRYQVATARTYLSAVKVFFRWVAHQGLYQDIGAPVKGIRTDKGFRRDSLPREQAGRLLDYLVGQADGGGVKALRDFVMVLLIVCCGLRVSEVSRLDLGDLDTVNGEPVIWVHGKGRDGKVDFIPIPPSLRDWLFRLLESRQSQGQSMSRSAPVFISYSHNRSGQRLSPQGVSRTVRQALMAIGISSPRLTAHSLRHTAVTLALEGGATLQQVQQFARHRLIETTLRYAHNLEMVRNPCPKLVMKLVGRLGKPKVLG